MVVLPGASPTAPQVPTEYTPLGVDLQRHFERAIQNGHVAGGPAEGELVEWSIVARYVPTDFSIRCVFLSTMGTGSVAERAVWVASFEQLCHRRVPGEGLDGDEL